MTDEELTRVHAALAQHPICNRECGHFTRRTEPSYLCRCCYRESYGEHLRGDKPSRFDCNGMNYNGTDYTV